jgi:hypothetical protein
MFNKIVTRSFPVPMGNSAMAGGLDRFILSIVFKTQLKTNQNNLFIFLKLIFSCNWVYPLTALFSRLTDSLVAGTEQTDRQSSGSNIVTDKTSSGILIY